MCPRGHSWRGSDGHKLVSSVTPDNLDNTRTSNIIFLFHSRSAIKGKIIGHVGNFLHMRKDGALTFFNNKNLNWFHYSPELLEE